MKLAVGVLCHNQLTNKRVGLFEDCIASVRKAKPDVLVVADNGSTDGTTERLAALPEFVGFPKIPGFPPGNTCGYGMNKLAATLAGKADVVVLSNDDIVWKPDAFTRLKEIWEAAPSELKIVSGLVEPTFQLPGKPPWNEPFGVLEAAEPLLVRRSVPGGAWSYRAEDTPLIFPLSTFPGVDDVPACHRLNQLGYQTACVELAAHEGADASTWGNGSERFQIETLVEVRERFGI